MAQEAEFYDPALQPDQARQFTRALRSLAEGGGGSAGAGTELREMAQKLLSGRMELRDVLASPSGSRALTSALSPLKERWDALSPEEREAVRDGSAPRTVSPDAEAETRRAAAADEAPRPRGRHARGQAPQSSSSQGRHTSGGWSLY